MALCRKMRKTLQSAIDSILTGTLRCRACDIFEEEVGNEKQNSYFYIMYYYIFYCSNINNGECQLEIVFWMIAKGNSEIIEVFLFRFRDWQRNTTAIFGVSILVHYVCGNFQWFTRIESRKLKKKIFMISLFPAHFSGFPIGYTLLNNRSYRKNTLNWTLSFKF